MKKWKKRPTKVCGRDAGSRQSDHVVTERLLAFLTCVKTEKFGLIYVHDGIFMYENCRPATCIGSGARRHGQVGVGLEECEGRHVADQ